jgi:GNAT superfamily N-acetyltransferase
MINAIEILEAGLEDVHDLARVEIETKTKSIPDVVSPVEVDPATRLQRWKNYLNGASSPTAARPERIVFKACIGQKLVGFVAGHLTTRYGKDAEIQLFYVLQENQRAGLGGKLLLQFLDWAGRHNAKSLCVGIAPNNKYKGFYLKYGGRYINPHWIYWDDMAALSHMIMRNSRSF